MRSDYDFAISLLNKWPDTTRLESTSRQILEQNDIAVPTIAFYGLAVLGEYYRRLAYSAWST